MIFLIKEQLCSIVIATANLGAGIQYRVEYRQLQAVSQPYASTKMK